MEPTNNDHPYQPGVVITIPDSDRQNESGETTKALDLDEKEFLFCHCWNPVRGVRTISITLIFFILAQVWYLSEVDYHDAIFNLIPLLITVVSFICVVYALWHESAPFLMPLLATLAFGFLFHAFIIIYVIGVLCTSSTPSPNDKKLTPAMNTVVLIFFILSAIINVWYFLTVLSCYRLFRAKQTVNAAANAVNGSNLGTTFNKNEVDAHHHRLDHSSDQGLPLME